MKFENSADLAYYYEQHRTEIMDLFLKDHKEDLTIKTLFTKASNDLAKKFFNEYLKSKGIDIEGCDCQLNKLAYMLLFSIQDHID